MRRISLISLVALALAACVPHDLEEPQVYDPRPVDMVYRVTVEPLKNNCGLDKPSEGLTVYVDVMPWENGTVQLKHSSIYIPLDDRTSGIVRVNGNVDHYDEWTSTRTDQTYVRHIHGHITPDELDLIVDSEEELWTVKGYKPCRKKVHLIGYPVPLKDPKALLGVYKMSFDEYGSYCFYQPMPGPAQHQFYARMDVRKHYDNYPNASFKLNDRLAFAWGLPDQTGQIKSGLDHNDEPNLSSFAYSDMLSSFKEYRSSAKGTIKPPKVDMDVWLGSIANEDLCGSAFRLHGQKLIPSAKSIDGYWRVQASGWNGCKNEPIDTAWQSFLMEQADGSIDLWEDDAALPLKRDGQRIHVDYRDDIDGYEIRMEGSLAPPRLSYFMELGFRESGQWCWVTFMAEAKPRFLD